MVATPSSPPTMPQHSFGRSSRACATISSTNAWEIFIGARLADAGGAGRYHQTVESRFSISSSGFV